MKVLMYGWEFPPKISGGLGVACYSIVKELTKKNIDVTIVLPQTIQNNIGPRASIVGCDTLSSEFDTSELEKQFNIDIRNIRLNSFLHPYISGSEFDERSKFFANNNDLITKLKSRTDLEKINELKDVVTRQKLIPITGQYTNRLFEEVLNYAALAGNLAFKIDHDVIHVHDWLTILAGVEAKKISKKPLVFHVHATEYDRSGDAVDTRIFAIEKYGMNQADKIVAVSEYTKKIIIEKYGILPGKIEVIYNGNEPPEINEPKLQKTNHNKMVLFLGRLAHQKGPKYFLDVARKILHHRKDIHFVIAGTGGLMPELVHYVAKYKLGRYIHFTGFLDKKRVDRLYKLADVYVMPSVSEPFGLSCLEALSHDVPVVISKQSGVSEVLHHVIKVDFWDINEMANKILALLDHNPLKRVSLSYTAKELPRLTWSRTVDAVIKLYNKMIHIVNG